jgi:2-phospho-L-lactate guanylyltransferase
VQVVTASDSVAEFAQHAGCGVLWQAGDAGTNCAFEHGVRRACEAGERAVLLLSGDLPMLNVEDVEHLVSGHPASRAVSIAPDATGRGTNALMVSPPDVLALRFGQGSFALHAAAAQHCAAELRVVRSKGFARDIDQASDLIHLPPALRAHALCGAQSRARHQLRGVQATMSGVSV